MDDGERRELVEELVAALSRAGVKPNSDLLLDLMRTEAGLVEALRVVRKAIDLIVQSTPTPPALGDEETPPRA